MGKSLSLDIRERVVSLVETGHSCHEASRRLCISAASAVRIMQRRRRTGSVAPALQGRPRQSKLDVVSDFLKGQIDAAPDITMSELATVLFERHTIRATPAMLSRHLIHRLNYTYKKIPDRYGKTARTSTCRAIRVDAPASTKDAS
jgi:transposase